MYGENERKIKRKVTLEKAQPLKSQDMFCGMLGRSLKAGPDY
jgi:hypothetical protein